MKKIFVLCLMMVLAISCFAFAGCSNKDDDTARQGIVYKCSFDYDGDGDTETRTIKTIAVGEKVEKVSDEDLIAAGIKGYVVKAHVLTDNVDDNGNIIVRITLEQNTYTITWDYNGGAALTDNRSDPIKVQYLYGEDINLAAHNPAYLEGHEFIGWAVGSPDGELLTSTLGCYENLVLYAVYRTI